MNDVGHLDDCKLVSGNELADLGPEAKGWLSAKYCIYPQVADLSGDLFRNDTPRKVLNLMHPFSQSVVLALPDRTIVEKIQVLRQLHMKSLSSEKKNSVNHNHFHFLPFDFCTTFTFYRTPFAWQPQLNM